MRHWFIEAAPQQPLGELEVARPGQLEVLDRARHQRGRSPSASIALASSVTCRRRPRPGPRAAGRGGTSAASAPATCRLRSTVACTRPSPLRSLQGVGHRQRQQAAHRVVAAGIDQRVDPVGAQQAARGVVHQHPVVARARRGRAGRRGRWPPSGRGWRRRSGHPQPSGACGGTMPQHLGVVRGDSTTSTVDARAPAPARPGCAPPRPARPAGHTAWGRRCRRARPRRRRAPRHSRRGQVARAAEGRSAWSSARRVDSANSIIAASSHASRRRAGRFRRSAPARLAVAPCTSRPSRPANATPCPARWARPMRCCWPALPRRRHGSRRTRLLDRHRRSGRHAAAGGRARLLRARTCACAVFPDWETLPYDTFSPHQDLISERLATLWRMQQAARWTWC